MRSEGWRCDLAGGDAICACDLTGRREGVVEKLIFREALQLRVAVHFGMAYQAQQHALRTPYTACLSHTPSSLALAHSYSRVPRID